jgi:hypothetical protein
LQKFLKKEFDMQPEKEYAYGNGVASMTTLIFLLCLLGLTIIKIGTDQTYALAVCVDAIFVYDRFDSLAVPSTVLSLLHPFLSLVYPSHRDSLSSPWEYQDWMD